MASPLTCTPNQQQTSPVNFLLWNPNVNDTNIQPIQNGFTLSSINRDTIYGPDYENTGKLGSSPMALAMISSTSGDFCMSSRITYTIDTDIYNQTIISGFMIMDEEYTPIAEAGIGVWNMADDRSIPPVTNPRTFFHVFEAGESSYPYREITSSYTDMSIQFNSSTGDITFDQYSINISSKTPRYIAIHMRGKGINTFNVENITYNGLSDISDSDIIKGTDLEKQYITFDLLGNKSSPIWTGNADEQSCATLCNINDDCINFTFDVLTNSCELKNEENFVNVVSSSNAPSPVPVTTKVNMKRPVISGIFLFYETVEGSSGSPSVEMSGYPGQIIDGEFIPEGNYPTVIEGNIVCLSIDNYMRDDFVLVDAYSRTYSGQFDYVPVPHPDTGKAVVSVAIKYGSTVASDPNTTEDYEYSIFLIFNGPDDIIILDENLQKKPVNVILLDNDTKTITSDMRFYNYEVAVGGSNIYSPIPQFYNDNRLMIYMRSEFLEYPGKSPRAGKSPRSGEPPVATIGFSQYIQTLISNTDLGLALVSVKNDNNIISSNIDILKTAIDTLKTNAQPIKSNFDTQVYTSIQAAYDASQAALGLPIDSIEVTTLTDNISTVFDNLTRFIDILNDLITNDIVTITNTLISIYDTINNASDTDTAQLTNSNNLSKLRIIFDTTENIIDTFSNFSTTYSDQFYTAFDLLEAQQQAQSPSLIMPNTSPFPEYDVMYLYNDFEDNELDPPIEVVIPKLVATDKSFDITNQGTTYEYSSGTPVNNKVFISPTLNKIILSENPYTSLIHTYPGMYTLMDDNSIWPTLKKGCLFSSETKPKGLWE